MDYLCIIYFSLRDTQSRTFTTLVLIVLCITHMLILVLLIPWLDITFVITPSMPLEYPVTLSKKYPTQRGSVGEPSRCYYHVLHTLYFTKYQRIYRYKKYTTSRVIRKLFVSIKLHGSLIFVEPTGARCTKVLSDETKRIS